MTSRSPRLLEGRVLRGCNVHHLSAVFSQRVDLGRLAGLRSVDAGPAFTDRFVERFPGLPEELLAELRSEVGAPIERVLLAAVVAVERSLASGMGRLDDVEFSAAVAPVRASRRVELAWTCHSGSLSRGAARVALAGLLEALNGRRRRAAGGGDFAALLERLLRRARRRQWSAPTAILARQARRRGIPFEPLAGEYLRLGEGALQHVLSAATPDLSTPESAGAELDRLFPSGSAARVPTALILGNRGTQVIARDLDGLLRAAGTTVGLATRKATTVGGKPVDPTSIGRGGGALFLLADPRVEAVVCAASPRRVVERGLRLERVTVAAILGPESDGDADADRRAIDVAVRATVGAVVLRAGHPAVEGLVGEVGARRVILVSSRTKSRSVRRHLEAGGCAVLLDRTAQAETLDLVAGAERLASVRVAALRSRATGVGDRRLRRAMFTLALAFGLGLTGDGIVAAIEKRRFLRR